MLGFAERIRHLTKVRLYEKVYHIVECFVGTVQLEHVRHSQNVVGELVEKAVASSERAAGLNDHCDRVVDTLDTPDVLAQDFGPLALGIAGQRRRLADGPVIAIAYAIDGLGRFETERNVFFGPWFLNLPDLRTVDGEMRRG